MNINPFKNAETFQICAEIDCIYWMLGEIQKRLAKTQTPIEIMIDKNLNIAECQRKEMIELVTRLIELKQKIKAPIGNSKKFLKSLTHLKI